MDRLVIYDLEAPEQYKTVALILTEVLREELFLLNRFILVNRENLLDVLREMALQQSGLIDEKQAIKAGKGLAANQVVTGSLGILGKTYLLNTKRIDVETFATLGIASTRFSKGEEEDALSRLPGLAKSLAGVR
ncbi:MAG: CsgG/HfaB family protein, partial [Proteobacteria bacterium]|nr:CsgG/HfaB family protein [Pseudomonadota bacterium]